MIIKKKLKKERLILNIKIRIFLLAVILLSLTETVLSHPHVFVDCELTFVFDQKGFSGIKEQWSFDEMFGNYIINDFDKNKDSKFSRQEIDEIKTKAFKNLKNFSYFTHLLIDGKRLTVEETKDFSAKIENGKLSYSFFVPCQIQAGKQFRNVAVALFDESYYTSLNPLTGSMSFDGKNNFVVQKSIEEIKELTFYHGMLIPKGVSIKFKQK
ncbi:putative DUF1007 family protein [Candidatus Magnetomoraceae bacterium gMMP-15]